VVFQHLVAGPVTVSTLAEKLAATQQAASKSVADLQHHGYVSPDRIPAEARAEARAVRQPR